MSRIFWDTNLFIYLFEGYGSLSQMTQRLRRKMLQRGDELLTSTFTVGEVLVKPTKAGDHALSMSYERAIASNALLVTFDRMAAREYASIRLDRTIKPPDAIQLACAAAARTDLFVTNDSRLQSKQISGIQFIVALDQVPL
jgi:uncharacterized protein